jgi:chorismate-pyruvate lyase
MSINIHSIFAINVQCTEQLKEWLNHQYSLTDKLMKIKGDARLELISQQWINTGWWDKNFLQIQDELVFQREIIMKSHDTPYWYARSIIPQKCYDRDAEFFGRLQDESIKNLIFGDDRVHRINLLSYPVDHQCIEFYWVKKYIDLDIGILWVRLAEFSFMGDDSFYIVEIMLPELENLIS